MGAATCKLRFYMPLWRNGQRTRLLIWGFGVRVPAGVWPCFTFSKCRRVAILCFAFAGCAPTKQNSAAGEKAPQAGVPGACPRFQGLFDQPSAALHKSRLSRLWAFSPFSLLRESPFCRGRCFGLFFWLPCESPHGSIRLGLWHGLCTLCFLSLFVLLASHILLSFSIPAVRSLCSCLCSLTTGVPHTHRETRSASSL